MCSLFPTRFSVKVIHFDVVKFKKMPRRKMKQHDGKAPKIWGQNFSNKRGIFMWCIFMHNLISDKTIFILKETK